MVIVGMYCPNFFGMVKEKRELGGELRSHPRGRGRMNRRASGGAAPVGECTLPRLVHVQAGYVGPFSAVQPSPQKSN